MESTRDYEESARRRAGRALGSFADRLNPPPQRELKKVEQEWRRAMEEARREWEEARAYFAAVSDPDLVDHAVHLLNAAEKKYNYLINKVKHQSVDGG